MKSIQLNTQTEIIELPDTEETRIYPEHLQSDIEEEEEEEPVDEGPTGDAPPTAQTIIDTVKNLSDDDLKEIAYTFRVTDEGINALFALTYGYRRISNLV